MRANDLPAAFMSKNPSAGRTTAVYERFIFSGGNVDRTIILDEDGKKWKSLRFFSAGIPDLRGEKG